tara:strand:+ start:2373 stop:3131 length:759 start_codon:yes stop_codon:yes gene_type:complete
MRGRHATRVAIRTFVGARDTAVIPHLSAIRARVKAAIHGRRIDASPRGASGLSRLLEHAAAEGFAALEATVDEGLIHVLVAVLIGPVTEFIRARVSGDVGVVAVGAHAHRADAVAVGVFVDAADGAHRETDGLEADGLVLGAFEAAGAVVELGGALLEADPLAAAQRTAEGLGSTRRVDGAGLAEPDSVGRGAHVGPEVEAGAHVAAPVELGRGPVRAPVPRGNSPGIVTTTREDEPQARQHNDTLHRHHTP